MFSIDFYLGSKLGMWLAKNGVFSPLDNFITNDNAILEVLDKRNLIKTKKGISSRAFSVHWPTKLESLLLCNYKYFLNIHPGYLPIGRGTFPVFWAVYLNQKAGITVHQVTDKIDFGPVLIRKEISFQETENAGQVWTRVFNNEIEVLLQAIDLLRYEDSLNFLDISNELIGKNRKRSEFEKFLTEPDLSGFTHYQLDRLVLALTHQDYDLPSWVKNLDKNMEQDNEQ